jgi:hypothetical protein
MATQCTGREQYALVAGSTNSAGGLSLFYEKLEFMGAWWNLCFVFRQYWMLRINCNFFVKVENIDIWHF